MIISLPPSPNFQNIWTGNYSLIWSGLSNKLYSYNYILLEDMIHMVIISLVAASLSDLLFTKQQRYAILTWLKGGKSYLTCLILHIP